MDLGQQLRASRSRATSVSRDRGSLRRTTAFVRARFAAFAMLLDACAISGSAVFVGVVYHYVFYRVGGVAWTSLELGLSLAFLFVLFNALRREYGIADYMTFGGHAGRVLLCWNAAMLSVLVSVFALKQTADLSRFMMALFYVVGLINLIGVRVIIVAWIKRSAMVGRLAALRVVLVGGEVELLDS